MSHQQYSLNKMPKSPSPSRIRLDLLKHLGKGAAAAFICGILFIMVAILVIHTIPSWSDLGLVLFFFSGAGGIISYFAHLFQLIFTN